MYVCIYRRPSPHKCTQPFPTDPDQSDMSEKVGIGLNWSESVGIGQNPWSEMSGALMGGCLIYVINEFATKHLKMTYTIN